MRVESLHGAMLNFWVAKSLGLEAILDGRGQDSVSIRNPVSGQLEPYQPAINWAQAGPLIANEWYDLESMLADWLGPQWSYMETFRDHPLLWLMRALVALRFGDEVEDWPPAGDPDD